MNDLNKFLLVFLLFVSFECKAFGQFRYFLKLFESNDKKFVAIIEENSRREQQIVKQLEDEKFFNDYKSKLKGERKTEIAIPGIYKTREEFLLLKNNSIQDDLKRKTIEILSGGSKGGIEESRAVNTFSKNALLSDHLQNKQILNKEMELFRERNSLKNVRKVQVYISIPETESEFKNIFNSVNRQQFENSKKIKIRLANEMNTNIHFLTNSDLLTNEILKSPDNMPIILIGHNEGGVFRLPDGSGKKFEKIDSLANVAKRSIIYLSCNSNTFTDNPTTNFYLTYSDGIAITNRINNEYLKTENIPKLDKIIANIIETYRKEKNQKLKYRIVIYSISISGIGYTLYEIK